MKITILTSAQNHPVHPFLKKWTNDRSVNHDIRIIADKNKAEGGDFLFLIACPQIVESEIRNRYRHSLVVHASDLPEGRGWSPYVWQILEGKNTITVSLLEAENEVDTGRIWIKKQMHLRGHELSNEIQDLLSEITVELMNDAVDNETKISPEPQKDETITYYRKRTPEDSLLDIDESIRSQINLLRVCDPDRYPAYFDYLGQRYKIKLEKIK